MLDDGGCVTRAPGGPEGGHACESPPEQSQGEHRGSLDAHAIDWKQTQRFAANKVSSRAAPATAPYAWAAGWLGELWSMFPRGGSSVRGRLSAARRRGDDGYVTSGG